MHIRVENVHWRWSFWQQAGDVTNAAPERDREGHEHQAPADGATPDEEAEADPGGSESDLPLRSAMAAENVPVPVLAGP